MPQEYKFTAQDARDIVIQHEYTRRGYINDCIQKAAKEGDTECTFEQLNLNSETRQQLLDDGFIIRKNTISWKTLN